MVTVGGGGIPVQGGNGGAGGTTSFGVLCIAYGGGGGWLDNGGWPPPPGNNDYGLAGAGAAPGVGELTSGGNSGRSGDSELPGNVVPGLFLRGVQGAAGPYGGAPFELDAVSSSAQGYNANGPGAGGGGAVAIQDMTTHPGGSGGAGLCIVTESIFTPSTAGCSPVPCPPPTGMFAVTEVPPGFGVPAGWRGR